MNKFNRWDLATISESSWVTKSLFILALVVLTSCLSYLLLIKENFGEYRLFVEEENQLKTEYAKKLPEVDLDAYQKQLAILQNRASTMLSRLPKKHELAASLEEISSAGHANGVVFELFTPGKKVKHDFYYELPLTIQAIGTYQQLAKFISHVTNLKYQLTVSNFVVKREKFYTNGGENKFLVLKMTLKIINHA